MQIKILENEYWWGGAVDTGDDAPYGCHSERTVYVGRTGEDQSASLYLSTCGRYIYSSKPFIIRFSNGNITVESDYEVEMGEGFGSLKNAHRAVAEKYFVHSGKIPDERIFSLPQ